MPSDRGRLYPRRTQVARRRHQDERHRRFEAQAEDHHHGRATIRNFNHTHRRYLGLSYPRVYPQWAWCVRRSA